MGVRGVFTGVVAPELLSSSCEFSLGACGWVIWEDSAVGGWMGNSSRAELNRLAMSGGYG